MLLKLIFVTWVSSLASAFARCEFVYKETQGCDRWFIMKRNN